MDQNKKNNFEMFLELKEAVDQVRNRLHAQTGMGIDELRIANYARQVSGVTINELAHMFTLPATRVKRLVAHLEQQNWLINKRNGFQLTEIGTAELETLSKQIAKAF
ncbi:hypothetical protein D1831_14410 [Lactiplantibacillus garii]|uniref:MarR family transcriptional regulator n=1 Tax=Lactiplantibacillus garii TaxID=2306423 RepID=A0A3R8KYS1_9LACO|nr:hypothetical protein [Lactiplantibacillus garii]RRK09148.1 hypothetical protein D1831_14410 [Lactiplantibacillus garii]